MTLGGGLKRFPVDCGLSRTRSETVRWQVEVDKRDVNERCPIGRAFGGHKEMVLDGYEERLCMEKRSSDGE